MPSNYKNSRPAGRLNVTSESNIGSEYTTEQVRFIMTVDRYKRLRNRPFPTWPEVLAVAKSLGYRKRIT